tara:strand:+ start:139 stop:327 length:189 start_codon:yes stop_codon:yes gene_type:complete
MKSLSDTTRRFLPPITKEPRETLCFLANPEIDFGLTPMTLAASSYVRNDVVSLGLLMISSYF